MIGDVRRRRAHRLRFLADQAMDMLSLLSRRPTFETALFGYPKSETIAMSAAPSWRSSVSPSWLQRSNQSERGKARVELHAGDLFLGCWGSRFGCRYGTKQVLSPGTSLSVEKTAAGADGLGTGNCHGHLSSLASVS